MGVSRIWRSSKLHNLVLRELTKRWAFPGIQTLVKTALIPAGDLKEK
jgi:hypothetical protein